eukprot:jgi/Bigna1/127138/aug1.4_g1846
MDAAAAIGGNDANRSLTYWKTKAEALEQKLKKANDRIRELEKKLGVGGGRTDDYDDGDDRSSRVEDLQRDLKNSSLEHRKEKQDAVAKALALMQSANKEVDPQVLDSINKGLVSIGKSDMDLHVRFYQKGNSTEKLAQALEQYKEGLQDFLKGRKYDTRNQRSSVVTKKCLQVMDRAEAIKTMLKAETLKKSGSMVQVKMAAASMQQAENADNELRFDDALKLFKESLEQWKGIFMSYNSAVELNTLPKELCVNIEVL